MAERTHSGNDVPVQEDLMCEVCRTWPGVVMSVEGVLLCNECFRQAEEQRGLLMGKKGNRREFEFFGTAAEEGAAVGFGDSQTRPAGLHRRKQDPRSRVTAEKVANEFLCAVEALFGKLPKLLIVGSIRRQAKMVSDIDIVIESKLPNELSRRRCFKAPLVEITADGKKKTLGLFKSKTNGDWHIDLYWALPDEFDAQVFTWTGSKTFNIRCRAAAKQRGLKLLQYGLFDGFGTAIAHTEEGILNALGLVEFYDPEARQ